MDLKKAITSHSKIEVDGQRLLFKGKRNDDLSLLGRILKDDQTLDSYKIEDGLTVNLIKTKVVETAVKPPPNREPESFPSDMNFPSGMNFPSMPPGGF